MQVLPVFNFGSFICSLLCTWTDTKFPYRIFYCINSPSFCGDFRKLRLKEINPACVWILEIKIINWLKHMLKKKIKLPIWSEFTESLRDVPQFILKAPTFQSSIIAIKWNYRNIISLVCVSWDKCKKLFPLHFLLFIV